MMRAMAKNGVEYDFHEIVEKCEGCERLHEEGGGRYCNSFANPQAQWRVSACSMATHIKVENKNAEKTRVGQQKQKKK